MYEIEFTREAVTDIREMRRRDQCGVLDAIEVRLRHQADHAARNRKRLRPNKLAEWELRIGDYRVFYDIDAEEHVMRIVAVGLKRGNALFIRGKEYKL